jgi:hypothetical protein
VLRIAGSLTPNRRHRFTGFILDCLEVSEGRLVGFVQGAKQFDYLDGFTVTIRHTPFVTIWRIEQASDVWVFCHQRRATLVDAIPAGIRIPGRSISRADLSVQIHLLGFGR